MVQLVILSCIGVFILLGVMEWTDSSFKSERQIGRYLNYPILGSVPDLTRVSNMMVLKVEVTKALQQGSVTSLRVE